MTLRHTSGTRRPASSTAKAHMSAARKGKAHPHKGVKASSAAKAHMSAAHRGKRHPHKGNHGHRKFKGRKVTVHRLTTRKRTTPRRTPVRRKAATASRHPALRTHHARRSPATVKAKVHHTPHYHKSRSVLRNIHTIRHRMKVVRTHHHRLAKATVRRFANPIPRQRH